jgi:XRE family transcriptional regulator, aerobic/anaerobic benzoate catabolism transcriptional regulator
MRLAAADSSQAAASDIGALLRAARAKRGMTRKQLAVASGASERYLAQIEAGQGNPTLSFLAAIAEALDVAPVELLPIGGERNSAYAAATAAVRRLPEERLRGLHGWIERPAWPDGAKAHRIVLIGLRGAGKSALGRALSERLGMPFFEVSKQIERAYGGNIGLLLELSGQAALSRYESEVWDDIQAEQRAAVIAVPGAIVANGPLYDRVLAAAHSIWLRATPEDHLARVMAQGDFRPMASNREAMADLKAILDARGADYAKADAQLDTSAQDFDATLDLLEARARSLVGA